VTASPAYRVYALALLGFVTLMYQLDRSVMYITQEAVKAEFRLSDAQLGVLTGLAYGLCNAAAGIPMGWLADRASRRAILSIIVAAWSAATAACGLAPGYGALVAARAATGLAESGGTPTSLSFLTDLNPPDRRASAIGFVFAGYSVGTVLSGLAGGWVTSHYGWRTTFLAYGAPGLVLAALLAATLREPQRTGTLGASAVMARALPAAAWRLLRSPGLRLIYATTALSSLISSGVFAWWAPFLLRTHHFALPVVGVIVGLAGGLAGIVGIIAAGLIADRARRWALGGPLLVLAGVALINLLATSLALWTPDRLVLIGALCVSGATGGVYIGPGNAVLSELAPPDLRAVAFSISVVITNLIGVSIGPLLIGVLSDAAQALAIPVAPLRLAMFLIILLQAPNALIYLLGGLKIRAP
jgi:predicted MFS family arabinose efflux permease